MVWGSKVRLRVCSMAGGSTRYMCGLGLKSQTECLVSAEKSNRRCGPGLHDQSESVVQGWMIRVRVWSSAGG